jgi:putative FmdB family regulatory protein
MPQYNFRCKNCNKEYEISMKLAEHTEQKDKLTCQECHSILTQSVARLRFQLNGTGWFANEGVGYEATQTELNKNLDMEKRIEDTAKEMQAKDKQKSKEF